MAVSAAFVDEKNKPSSLKMPAVTCTATLVPATLHQPPQCVVL